jgi:hypothetical protein
MRCCLACSRWWHGGEREAETRKVRVGRTWRWRLHAWRAAAGRCSTPTSGSSCPTLPISRSSPRQKRKDTYWNAGNVPTGNKNIATNRTAVLVVPIIIAFPTAASSIGTTMCQQRSLTRPACAVTARHARKAANHGGAVSRSVCVLEYPSEPTIDGKKLQSLSQGAETKLLRSTYYVNVCASRLQCCVNTNSHTR